MNAPAVAIVLGIGVVTLAYTPVHAQFGDMGDAATKGAVDAAQERLMKDAAAGVPAPGATTSTDPGAASAPGDAPDVTSTTHEAGGDTGTTPTTTLP